MWAWGLGPSCHLAISDTVIAPGVFDIARRAFFKNGLGSRCLPKTTGEKQGRRTQVASLTRFNLTAIMLCTWCRQTLAYPVHIFGMQL